MLSGKSNGENRGMDDMLSIPFCCNVDEICIYNKLCYSDMPWHSFCVLSSVYRIIGLLQRDMEPRPIDTYKSQRECFRVLIVSDF